MARDYYADLGVSRTASEDDIRKAYRALAQKLHPDKNQGDEKVEQRFKEVNQAYHALSDAKKRKLYDEFGEAGLREGFNPDEARAYARGRGFPGGFAGAGFGGASAESGGFSDLFGDLFGGGGRRRPRRGPDAQSEITVSFQSAVRGAELELALDGASRKVKVRIPKGANDGDRVRVAGAAGVPGPGIPPGDLLLTLRVKPHPHFERDGLDLTLDLPITAQEAYQGARIDVPTPSGHVNLKVPARTQSGQLLRLRGKGVERGNKSGDLYVRFLVRLPDETSPEIERAIETLGKHTSTTLRDAIEF